MKKYLVDKSMLDDSVYINGWEGRGKERRQCAVCLNLRKNMLDVPVDIKIKTSMSICFKCAKKINKKRKEAKLAKNEKI